MFVKCRRMSKSKRKSQPHSTDVELELLQVLWDHVVSPVPSIQRLMNSVGCGAILTADPLRPTVTHANWKVLCGYAGHAEETIFRFRRP